MREGYLGPLAVRVPPFSADQAQALAFFTRHYAHALNRRSREVLNKVLAHPGVRRRHFGIKSTEEMLETDPDKRISRFTRWAVELSAQAARAALERAELAPAEVSAIVVNTCTGYLCPGISTYLVERLGLRRDVEAYDLVGSGCGGAIPNLRMCQAVLGRLRRGVALSVSVEICSATFQMDNDLSLIISNAIFGDGAAASVIWQRPQGLAIVDVASRHCPEYREEIRYVYRRGQLHNQLSSRLPALVGETVRELVGRVIKPPGLEIRDIRHWAFHPGGENILNAMGAALDLPEASLSRSREVLSNYGNMSSPTVLFVLERIIAGGVSPGDWVVLVAFGAGFSAHVLLLRSE